MGHATYVYVISGDHGRQKIGISDNPRQRLKDLQTGSPYALKFEFVGETENGAAGQIEVEAHFLLNQHKAPGGEEWFVVPPDVAITAVMAAAHRLGYRCKPVDADAVAPPSYSFKRRRPLWVMIAMLPLYGWFGYWIFGISDARMMSGELPLGAFAIEAAVMMTALWLASWIVQWLGQQVIAACLSFDHAMHPDDGVKAPLPPP